MAPGQKPTSKVENAFTWVTLGLLGVSWVVGFNRARTDLSEVHPALWPQASSFAALGFEAEKATNHGGETLGYVLTGTHNGFGGPLKVAVGVKPDGTVRRVMVLEHRESPSWFSRVMTSPLLSQLSGKGYRDPMELGVDIDVVTGATFTSRAISTATKEATLEAARRILGLDTAPYLAPKRIRFELPEICLLMLMTLATLGPRRVPKRYRKTLRWFLMILGAALLGFAFNHPLNLVGVNRLLMGYWPDLYNQLYWYILIFGIVVIFLTTGRNTYCHHICPFGAVQECLAAVSGAKGTFSKRYGHVLNWTRRVVVLCAIMLAFIYRNPGMSSYEVYGTLFNLLGTNFELLFLSLVLVFALFIKRPWCSYLCPMPVVEYYSGFLYRNTVRALSRIPVWLARTKGARDEEVS